MSCYRGGLVLGGLVAPLARFETAGEVVLVRYRWTGA
jgi:hypothetical protein